jgi:hypothetical protein
MNFTLAAIEKNRVTFVTLIVVALAGMSAFSGMPRAEDPGFIIRVAQVMTLFPGASPERVEQLVMDKLEKTIQEMPELDFVTSTSRSGVSLVFPQILTTETDMRPIWDSLRRKVERASRELPADIIGPFVNDEFGDVFGTIITLTGEGYDYAELKDVADQVRNELLMIPQTAKVQIQGAREERIFVEYNNARLAEIGISAFHLMNTLENRNIVLPGGAVNTGDERIVLEPSGNFESVEELRHTMVDVPGSRQLLYLEDIARVKRGYIDPPSNIVRSSGVPALAISISLREGGNLIELGKEVKARIDRMRERYPIKVIETGSQRVATIVNSLRNFARLDEEDMKQVDLHQGIEDSLMLINHEIKGRIEIIKEFGSLPQVECFPGRLNQVFLNILNNAQQSIEGSGKITIATSVDGATVRVKIADTGGGIPPDKLSKVFDPGYTTKGIGAGTGLGLSICYEIMEEHKGGIEVESEVGTGSSYTVVVPIAAPEQT